MKHFIDEIIYFTGSEPTICKTFGCGRTLTMREQLFGSKCIKCTGNQVEPEIDLKKVLRANQVRKVIEDLEAGIKAIEFESTGTARDRMAAHWMQIKIGRLLSKLK